MSDKYNEEHIREIQRMRMTLDEETGMQRMKRKFREEPFVPAARADGSFVIQVLHSPALRWSLQRFHRGSDAHRIYVIQSATTGGKVCQRERVKGTKDLKSMDRKTINKLLLHLITPPVQLAWKGRPSLTSSHMPISSGRAAPVSPDLSMKARRSSTPSSQTSSTSGVSSNSSKKIFSEPIQKYQVQSKVGSRDNIRHKPQGGEHYNIYNPIRQCAVTMQRYANYICTSVIENLSTVKIIDEKIQWNAQPKVPTKAEARAKKNETSPPDAKRRVSYNKLDLSKVTSKVGSLDNARRSSRDEKTESSEAAKKAARRVSRHIIPDQKLDFSKVTSKVGSKDNIRHKPGGGQNKIYDEKPVWKAETKLPKPDKMTSLTRKLAEVNIGNKPSSGKELEEDVGENPFLSDEPEQLEVEPEQMTEQLTIAAPDNDTLL
ncbi:hypothetical protein NQZ79_g288 [Umbelopsis isabellina]|nr:hypothetical protein NQZ79_g288 [Umbelopsis isabellina]